MTLGEIYGGHWVVLGYEIGLAAQIVVSCVAVLSVWFLLHYVRCGAVFILRVRSLIGKIHALHKDGAEVPPDHIARLMEKDRVLAHLWSEYAETLHEQWKVVDGERQRVRVRATMPAETYFTTDVLVDTRLGTEFFKHLPGILTGIGIIGTFYGLITGLGRFNLHLDPETLQISIGQLMGAVKEAFIASGLAIAAAMCVTVIEKILLASCYKKVEALAHAIDTLYEAGAGEEYLARLVQSSEESAVQTRHLKDSLVDDMRQLLTELTERQIDAGRRHGDMLAGQVGDAIRSSLAEPMQSISTAMDRTSTKQREAVHGMLEDLLSAFMEKLDGSLGGQMNGLQNMMAGTVQAMEGMRSDFANMLDKMGETSGKASQAATEQVVRLMAEAEERQRQMSTALLEVVRDMRQQLAAGQAEMQEQTVHTLDQLRVTLQEMLEEIRRQREEASRSASQGMAQVQDSLAQAVNQIRTTAQQMGQLGHDQLAKMLDMAEQRQAAATESLHQAMESMAGSMQGFMENAGTRQQQQAESAQKFQQDVSQRTTEVLAALDQRLGELAVNSARAVESMQGAVQALNGATGRAIDGMSRGADTMLRAADGFTQAGGCMEHTVGRTAEMLDRVVAASSSLDMSVRAVESVVGSYNATRDTLHALITTLQRVVDDAEARAGVSRELVQTMQTVVADFRHVQQETSTYLDNIGGVLKTGFDTFSDAVTTNMRRSHGEFHKSLTDAVQMISGQLQELDAILGGFTAKAKTLA